jgi:hypothetical protein
MTEINFITIIEKHSQNIITYKFISLLTFTP